MTVARIKYSKENELKYISHLDFQRTFHRMLNRAGITVAHSQGFNPHPKVSYAMAMPVGMTSEGEYLDVELENSIDANTIKELLNQAAPKGLVIQEVRIFEDSLKAISAVISEGIFKVEIPLHEDIKESEIMQLIDRILLEEKIELTRKNKKGKIVQKDIRPHIKKLVVDGIKDNKLYLEMIVSIGSNENLNPQMLINYIMKQHKGFKEFPLAKVHRVNMITSGNKTPIDI